MTASFQINELIFIIVLIIYLRKQKTKKEIMNNFFLKEAKNYAKIKKILNLKKYLIKRKYKTKMKKY